MQQQPLPGAVDRKLSDNRDIFHLNNSLMKHHCSEEKKGITSSALAGISRMGSELEEGRVGGGEGRVGVQRRVGEGRGGRVR